MVVELEPGVACELDRADTISWLLAGDPAIRWQTLADLTDASPEVVASSEHEWREGWGAELLDLQDADGGWAGALYSPKWTSTTYTLLLLHWLGLPSDDGRARRSCEHLWDGVRRYDDGLNFAKSIREPETCITAMMVLLSSSFRFDDGRLDATVQWLLGQQLPDGGWNCESIRSGSRHGSFHTSISTLDALHAYAQADGQIDVSAAMAVGRQFFLDHSLYRSHRTGDVVDPAFTRFPFPPQWHFDVLRGLEHFRASGAEADDRLSDAVAVIRAGRRAGDRWHRHRPYPGREWFVMEPAGPSRWATLRCLRILDWWDEARA